MTPRLRTRAASAAALPLVLTLLAGCATSPVSNTVSPGSSGASGTSQGTSGSAAATTPTPTYPYTPAATPTIMPSGADAKPSKGGPTLAATAGGPLNGKIVFVDPGHSGGYAPDLYHSRVESPWGGVFMCSSTGTDSLKLVKPVITEHALNWTVANKAADALRAAGATVVMSRPSDDGAGPCNYNRALAANAAKADFLLSIHADGEGGNAASKDPQGFHVQTETKMAGGKDVYARSLAAAETLVREMSTTGKQPVTNYIPRKPVGVWQRTKELTVLGGAKMPGILVEMGNMHNKKDLARIIDGGNQDLMVQAMVATVTESLTKPAPTPGATATVTASATATVTATTTVTSPAPTR